MEVIKSIELYEKQVNTSIALGTFDGVHLAHATVIKEAVDSEFTPAVFSFSQLPSAVINGEQVPSITTRTTKQELIEKLGVKLFFCPSFLDFKDMSAEDFVIMLKEKLGAKKLSCGFNFTFGAKRTGNPQVLKQLCKQYDIELKVVPPVLVSDAPVSSTRIRAFIQNGELDKARELLGHDFYYTLDVVKGNHIGTTLEIPTINQVFPTNFILPKFGVYASKVIIDGVEYKSITNVGVKPTIGDEEVCSETNIFDYKGDLYDKKVTVVLKFFIRPERKFENLDELTRAIHNDIDYVKNMIY